VYSVLSHVEITSSVKEKFAIYLPMKMRKKLEKSKNENIGFR